jgi:hypothetical protein
MAKFSQITLTKQGIEMIALSQGSGDALKFGSIRLGDGQLATGDDVSTFTDLKHPALSLPIHSYQNKGNGQITLEAILSNTTVSSGFFARELGIYAKVGDGGADKLYGYAYAGNYADYVPDKTNPLNEDKIDVSLIIGNVNNVTAVIDSSIIYVTIQQFEAHKADTNAHTPAINKHNTDPLAHDAIFGKVRNLIAEAKKEALLESHPVGSYYQSEISTNPSVLFGGTWQEITGVFLLARDNKHTVGSTGGSFYHVQSAGEMPNHGHNSWVDVNNNNTEHFHYFGREDGSNGGKFLMMRGSGTADNPAVTAGTVGSQWNGSDGWHGLRSVDSLNLITSLNINTNNSSTRYPVNVGTNGGNQAMDITNPYRAVYTWKRTA